MGGKTSNDIFGFSLFSISDIFIFYPQIHFLSTNYNTKFGYKQVTFLFFYKITAKPLRLAVKISVNFSRSNHVDSGVANVFNNNVTDFNVIGCVGAVDL